MTLSSPKAVAIIGNDGFSMLNFRGPLIAEIVARGHNVYALAPKMPESIAAALRQLGADPIQIEMSRTGTNPAADIVTVLRLLALLKRLAPDVTLSYAAKPAIYGTIAAWVAGIPSRFAMIEGLGYMFIDRPDEGLPKRSLRALVVALYRLALRRAQKVFFLNPDDIADFSKLGLLQPDQAINIGGIGVDLDMWEPAPPIVDPPTFIFIGRLLKDKGVVDFVDAARLVKAAHPRTRFLLVGSIDENPESVALSDVQTWVQEALLEWPGHVPVVPWLERSSVFVLPSYYREGVPRSTQEAMAMARPVITTDSVGCRETVLEGKNGYLVPPRDAPALAEAMRRFIDNPTLIADMGLESRRLAEERFDVRKVNARIIDILGL